MYNPEQCNTQEERITLSDKIEKVGLPVPKYNIYQIRIKTSLYPHKVHFYIERTISSIMSQILKSSNFREIGMDEKLYRFQAFSMLIQDAMKQHRTSETEYDMLDKYLYQLRMKESKYVSDIFKTINTPPVISIPSKKPIEKKELHVYLSDNFSSNPFPMFLTYEDTKKALQEKLPKISTTQTKFISFDYIEEYDIFVHCANNMNFKLYRPYIVAQDVTLEKLFFSGYFGGI